MVGKIALIGVRYEYMVCPGVRLADGRGEEMMCQDSPKQHAPLRETVAVAGRSSLRRQLGVVQQKSGDVHLTDVSEKSRGRMLAEVEGM